MPPGGLHVAVLLNHGFALHLFPSLIIFSLKATPADRRADTPLTRRRKKTNRPNGRKKKGYARGTITYFAYLLAPLQTLTRPRNFPAQIVLKLVNVGDPRNRIRPGHVHTRVGAYTEESLAKKTNRENG